MLPDDWDQFEILMDNAIQRVPALETAEVKQFINGPESFTADNNYILGEAPGGDGLVRRRRLQLDGHRLVRRRRQGAGRMDRHRASRSSTCGRSTSAASPASTSTAAC